MHNQQRTFWMVLGSGAPTFRHPSEVAAKAEAERLARMSPGNEFVVLESIASVKKSELQWSVHCEMPFDPPF